MFIRVLNCLSRRKYVSLTHTLMSVKYIYYMDSLIPLFYFFISPQSSTRLFDYTDTLCNYITTVIKLCPFELKTNIEPTLSP